MVIVLVSFCQLHELTHAWKEGISTEDLPLLDWPVMHFLDFIIDIGGFS